MGYIIVLIVSKMDIDLDPFNDETRVSHSEYLNKFNMVCNDEEWFLIHKSKVNWLKEGDKNTIFFSQKSQMSSK